MAHLLNQMYANETDFEALTLGQRGWVMGGRK